MFPSKDFSIFSVTTNNSVSNKTFYQGSQRCHTCMKHHFGTNLTQAVTKTGGHCAPACRCLRVMERALGNIYFSDPLYRPGHCQKVASSGRGAWVEQVALGAHIDTEADFTTFSLAVSLEPLYGDCFISVPVRPLGDRGPRRMTLIFWKQSVQYWSAGMSSPDMG